jgi:hypothetical protein
VSLPYGFTGCNSYNVDHQGKYKDDGYAYVNVNYPDTAFHNETVFKSITAAIVKAAIRISTFPTAKALGHLPVHNRLRRSACT